MTKLPYARATYAVLISMFIFACSSNIMFACLRQASQTFQVSFEDMTPIISVQFSGFFLTCLLGGIASDRFGKKRVMLLGCFLTMLGALGWTMASGLRAAYVGAFILGMGGGILETIGAAILTDLHPERSKFFMNLSQAAYCLGAIGSPALMAVLLPLGLSWRWFFFGNAVIAVILGVMYMGVTLAKSSEGSRQRGNLRSVMRVLPTIIIPCICIFCYVFSEMATAGFLGERLAQLSAPESMTIFALSLFWSAMILGRIACAFLPQNQAYEHIIGALLLLAGLACVAQSMVQTWQASIALFTLTGLAFAGTWPMIVSMASYRNLEDSGVAAGITISIGSLGCIANPIVIAPIFKAGRHDQAFMLLGGILLFGAAMMLLSLVARLHKTRTQTQPN
ncbi:MAG TPA: MFS transporter [Lentisphaeria bacterium]|nr:MFS transporter [Lentisphaeria bacterium]